MIRLPSATAWAALASQAPIAAAEVKLSPAPENDLEPPAHSKKRGFVGYLWAFGKCRNKTDFWRSTGLKQTLEVFCVFRRP